MIPAQTRSAFVARENPASTPLSKCGAAFFRIML
jgi:hypothetical protein